MKIFDILKTLINPKIPIAKDKYRLDYILRGRDTPPLITMNEVLILINPNKNQKFLALIYSLQNNNSNAARDAKRKAEKLQKKKVYAVYDFGKMEFIYYLNPTDAEKAKNQTKSAKSFIQGHRHKIFTNQDIENIKDLKKQGLSNRKIAKIYHCDEKTIRNYLN